MNGSQVNNDLTEFQRSLPMLLHRTMAAILPPFREIFGDHNLTDQQWRVLRALWECAPLNVAELAEMTVLPAPSLVGILDRLEARKLVERVRSEKDRRSVFVTATTDGRALYTEVEPRIQATHEALRKCATEAEWNALEEILQKIATAEPAHIPDTSRDSAA